MNIHLGFIGIGRMGGPMAGRLIDAGYTLTVFDSRVAALRPLCSAARARRRRSCSIQPKGCRRSASMLRKSKTSSSVTCTTTTAATMRCFPTRAITCMCHATIRFSFEADDVVEMVRRVYAGRVQFHDGDAQIAPGMTVHHVGGHTMGLQVMRIWTRRGWVALASDTSHTNMEQVRPYPVVYNVADMLAGHGRLRELASSPPHIIPGHDPLVFARYPAAAPQLEGAVVRLDADPRQ